MTADDLADLFGRVGSPRVKRMFGGHGIYLDGVMVALEAGGQVYLKVDSVTTARFAERGLEAFTYEKNGKAYAMSYRRLPEEAHEDSDRLREWVSLAREAAVRADRRRRPAS
jgi:DNA transformation protein